MMVCKALDMRSWETEILRDSKQTESPVTAQIIAMREFPSCVPGTGNSEWWTPSAGDSMERSRWLELSVDRAYKGERYIEIKLQKRTPPNNQYDQIRQMKKWLNLGKRTTWKNYWYKCPVPIQAQQLCLLPSAR